MDQDVPIGLTLDEVKTLDQVRMRLSQLTHSMQSLAQSVYSSNPLPDPASLQAFHNILQKSLESLNTVLLENSDLFSRIAIHPSTNFDGRKYENVLLNLLRKKLETGAEIWADEGRAAAVASLPPPSASSLDQQPMTVTEREEDEKRRMNQHWEEQQNLADRVRGVFTEHIKDYIESEEPSLFTKEEKEMGPLEQVRTGLRRDLVAEEKAMFEDSDDEDGDVDQLVPDAIPGMGWAAGRQQQQQQQQQQQPGQIQGQMPMQMRTGMQGGQQQQYQPQHQQMHSGAGSGLVTEHTFWFGVNGDTRLPSMVDQVGRRVAKKTGPGPMSMPGM